MPNIIDMQDMRYLSLFAKIARINTRFCFMYNETLIFCVPKHLISKAIGPGAENIRKMSGIVKKRIKIVPAPSGIQHLRPFIEAIVSPVTFKGLEVKDNEVILTAGIQSKAALLGRNKRRLLEMQKIVKNFFGKEFRII